jgi:hypothetical protein
MTMLEQSQQADWLQTELESMSSQEVSPAKTSQLQAQELASMVSEADYGQSAPVYLGTFSPVTPSLKTSQTCLMENGEIGFAEFSGTFPRSGMMRNGTVYQLPQLVRTIDETASGLWPTPLAQESKHGAPTRWEMKTDHKGTKDSLRVQVNKRPLWPTPTAMTGGEGVAPSHLDGTHGWSLGAATQDSLSANPIRSWPTPRASEYKGVGPLNSKSHQHMLEKRYLCAVVQDKEQKTGKLNPQWVEWLMGFPVGHTDLNV